MKTSEAKTAAQNLHRQQANQPFFRKEEESPAVFGPEPEVQPFFSPPGDGQGVSPFFSPSIQPKLKIGQPGDQYEQEADAMAEKVVQRLEQSNERSSKPVASGETSTNSLHRSTLQELHRQQQEGEEEEAVHRKPIFESEAEPVPESVQRQALPASEIVTAPNIQHQGQQESQDEEEISEEEPELQRKPIFESDGDGENSTLQAKETDQILNLESSGPGSNLESRLAATKGSGAPMGEGTRTSMESAFGSDFSGVRVHTDTSSVQMSQELGARAFTHGSDVYFNAGQYDPGSGEGKKLLAHELTHVVQQGGGGDSAPKVQLSPATDLISQYTSYLNLQEGPLGAELLRRINRGETEIAHSVLDELGWTDRDDVSYEIMVRATDTNLNAWMGSGEGRRLLERLFDQLTQGSVGEEEQREASRILYIKSMHIPTSEIPTELSEIKVFPYRLPGLTVFHDAPIMAERAGGGSIRVEQPVRVLGTDEFRPETITLPTQVFINGIEIPENEIIGVKMYDLGGEIHFRPALYLIQLSNETDATVLQKILEVSAIGITLGAGSLASLGVEASMTARVLLWADRAAFVIGTLTSVINEHRGWIISTFGESGRTFLRYNNLLNQIVGWYGIVRTVYEIPNLIRNFRTSYQNWRTLAREMSEEITSPQSSIIDDIGRNTDDFFDNVTSIEQARSTRAAAEGASGRSSGGASVGSEGQATIYEFPSGTQATLGQGEGSPQILNRPSSPQVAQGGTQGNVRVLRPRQPVEASVSGNTALDINSLPESLPVVEPLPPVPEPISVPEQVPGQITTPGTAAPTAPGQSTGTMANIGTGLHVAPDPATATNPQQQTASQSDQEEDDNQAVRVELILPPPKAIHLGSYFGKLGFLQHSVTRPDRDTSQRTKWEQNVRNEMPLEVYYWGISLGLDEVDIFRPYWSADRNFSPQRRMQVDHLIEWQVRPLSGGQWIDEPWNFELLDASSNGSAGPRMRGNIRRQRESLAQRTGDSSWLTRDLTFNWVSAESPGIAFRWSFDEIVRGDHLLAYERLTGETKNEELFRYYMEQFAGG